jgi:hypothetical protein
VLIVFLFHDVVICSFCAAQNREYWAKEKETKDNEARQREEK